MMYITINLFLAQKTVISPQCMAPIIDPDFFLLKNKIQYTNKKE